MLIFGLIRVNQKLKKLLSLQVEHADSKTVLHQNHGIGEHVELTVGRHKCKDVWGLFLQDDGFLKRTGKLLDPRTMQVKLENHLLAVIVDNKDLAVN